MAGTAFGIIAGHLFGPAAGAPAIYGVIAMGAVFAAAARAPLTAIASVAEMTGNYGLILPVMLAVAIATGLARRLSYGSIYTRKLLRRGIDIELHGNVNQARRATVAEPDRGPVVQISPAERGHRGKQDRQAGHDQDREVGGADSLADLVAADRPAEQRQVPGRPDRGDRRRR
jgi:chloride channel protein, CIC family